MVSSKTLADNVPVCFDLKANQSSDSVRNVVIGNALDHSAVNVGPLK